MTEPPDMDRLREVVTEAIDAVIGGWMQGDPWPDDERLADAVLAALLPVHRAMVLGEAADAWLAWMGYGRDRGPSGAHRLPQRPPWGLLPMRPGRWSPRRG